MSATRTVTSLLDGRPVDGAPGGTLTIPNPADLKETVANAKLGDAGTFLEACRRAKAAQPGWAAIPAPVRGRAIQHLGRLVEENFETL
jgi:acyl-CoA reductase-like NAD-dependent aldehyde dehydrogenase